VVNLANIARMLKATIIFLVLYGTSVGSVAQSAASGTSSGNFSEGVVYSRATFPGHPLYASLKALDFQNGDFNKQSHTIKELKEYQQSIKQENEEGIKDAFFISGIMVLPQYSKMYLSANGSLVQTQALGYQQETFINNNTGRLSVADRNKTNQVTVDFAATDMLEVWQKYQVGTAQYSVQKTNETSTVEGFKCKKLIYTFNGTSGGTPVTNYIINLQPEKVTVWYTDELPAAINVIHPLFFELDKAIMKFEVQYDKSGKNKMLVEITGIEPGKINEEDLQVRKMEPSVAYQKNDQQSQMMIMMVMMNAISNLTKE
jgi:hypothetical protein